MTIQNHSGVGDNYFINGDATFDAIQKHPTILAEIINELGNKIFSDDYDDPNSYDEFDIIEKIKYNNIVKYKEVIEEHKVYQGKLNAIYKELDAEGSSKKLLLLRNIRNLYIKIKGSYINKSNGHDPISTIQQNSDAIIEEVEKQLLLEIDRSNNIRENLETIKIALLIIIVDAFMRCKILEEPI